MFSIIVIFNTATGIESSISILTHLAKKSRYNTSSNFYSRKTMSLLVTCDLCAAESHE